MDGLTPREVEEKIHKENFRVQQFQAACTSGRWRDVANLYKKAIDKTQGRGSMGFFHISGYCSVFTERQSPVTPADLKFIDSIVKNLSFPLVCRVHAAFALGLCNFEIRDRQQAINSYRKCIELSDSAKAKDFKGKFRDPASFTGAGLDVKSRIESCRKDAESNMAVGRAGDAGGIPDHVRNPAPRTIDGIPLSELPQEMRVGINENRFSVKQDRTATSEEAARRVCAAYRLGGGECDRCGKKADACEGKLLRCGSCRKAWYCTTECQKAAWSGGHKKMCKKRAPGQLLKDDVCQVKGLISKQGLNGTYVTIVGPSDGKEGRYVCKLGVHDSEMASTAPEASIKVDNLALMVARTR